MQLLRVYPLGGPTQGGTILTITGVALAQHLKWMRFTRRVNFAPTAVSALVPVRWLSESRIECMSPRLSAGLANLEVSTNGQQFTTAHLNYLFFQPVTLHSIDPIQGPPAGGSIVRIDTSDLRTFAEIGELDAALACRFNSTDVPAVLSRNMHDVTCVAPQHMLGGVSVNIVANDHHLANLAGL